MRKMEFETEFDPTKLSVKQLEEEVVSAAQSMDKERLEVQKLFDEHIALKETNFEKSKTCAKNIKVIYSDVRIAFARAQATWNELERMHNEGKGKKYKIPDAIRTAYESLSEDVTTMGYFVRNVS